MGVKWLRQFALLLSAASLVTYWPVVPFALLTFFLSSQPRRLFPFWQPLLVFSLCLLMSAALSDWPGLALTLAVILSGTLCLLSYIFITRLEQRDCDWLLVGLCVGTVISFIAACYQVFGLQIDRVTPLTFHPNVAASILCLTVLILIALALTEKKPLFQGVAWASALLALLTLAYTGSRGAILGLGVALVFVMLRYLIQRLPRLGQRTVLLGLLGIACLGLALLWWPSQQNVTNLIRNPSFEQGRLGYQTNRSFISTDEAVYGSQSLMLERTRTGWEVLLADSIDLFQQGEASYVLSFWVKPLHEAVNGLFIRISVRDQDSGLTSRLGNEGWTDRDEGYAGGRIFLPVETSEWQRLSIPFEASPYGGHYYSIMVASDYPQTGRYGYLDALQLEQGRQATAFQGNLGPAWYDYLGPLAPRLNTMVRQPLGASGGRVTMWLLSLELASYKPFLGYGMGSVERLITPMAPRLVADPLAHPHNVYLQLLLDGGSLTLVAFLMLCGVLIRALIKRATIYSTLALAGCMALGIDSVFDLTFYQDARVQSLWLLLVAVGLVFDEKAPQQR